MLNVSAQDILYDVYILLCCHTVTAGHVVMLIVIYIRIRKVWNMHNGLDRISAVLLQCNSFIFEGFG